MATTPNDSSSTSARAKLDVLLTLRAKRAALVAQIASFQESLRLAQAELDDAEQDLLTHLDLDRSER